MKAMWTGFLSFGLINIPTKLYSGTDDHSLHFELFHTKDHSSIRYARICTEEEKEVPWDEIVKGYEVREGEFEKIVSKLIPKEKKNTIQWVKPFKRCRVAFLEWTNSKKLRLPRFIQLVEEPFSNLEKVFWPKENITKGDLIAYYRKIAPIILPHLKDRPQVLHRYPDGIEGEDFYQKKAGNLSKEIPSVYVKPDKRYLLAQDEKSLLYLINLGCIELNPFCARIGSLEFPDYLVIDLDPRGVSFISVVKVAREFKKLCDHIGLNSFPKTSGKEGLHIYIPTGGKYSYETICTFAELLCHSVLYHITIEKSAQKRE